MYTHTHTYIHARIDVQIPKSPHHLQHVEPSSLVFLRFFCHSKTAPYPELNRWCRMESIWIWIQARIVESVQNTPHMPRRRLQFPTSHWGTQVCRDISIPCHDSCTFMSWICLVFGSVAHDLQHHWGSAGVNLGLDAKVLTLCFSHRFQCEKNNRTTLSPHPPSWFVLNLRCSVLLLSPQDYGDKWNSAHFHPTSFVPVPCDHSLRQLMGSNWSTVHHTAARTAFTDEWVAWRRSVDVACSPTGFDVRLPGPGRLKKSWSA